MNLRSNWRWVPVALYGAGVVGTIVTNLIAARAFFAPVYGVWALGAALVYDAVWLGASWQWIRTGRRDGLTKALLFGGVVGAVAIQAWAGWSELGTLGLAIITAGDQGRNLAIGGLIVLRHAAMPLIGLACVHALAGVWEDLAAERNTEQPHAAYLDSLLRGPGPFAPDPLADTPPAKPKRQRKAAPKPATEPRASDAERWAAIVERHGPDHTLTELAELEGVSRQRIGQIKAGANGHG